MLIQHSIIKELKFVKENLFYSDILKVKKKKFFKLRKKTFKNKKKFFTIKNKNQLNLLNYIFFILYNK
jgi:hypothetical protein